MVFFRLTFAFVCLFSVPFVKGQEGCWPSAGIPCPSTAPNPATCTNSVGFEFNACCPNGATTTYTPGDTCNVGNLKSEVLLRREKIKDKTAKVTTPTSVTTVTVLAKTTTAITTAPATTGATAPATSWPEPKIVILAGPHKTGSSTIQSFMANWAGEIISVLHSSNNNNTQRKKDQQQWVWPLGRVDECSSAGIQEKWCGETQKFYAPLAVALIGRDKSFFKAAERDKIYANDQMVVEDSVIGYYRALMKQVWQQQLQQQQWKKIVFGSEEIDKLLVQVYETEEDPHISLVADEYFKRLLSVLPWDENGNESDNSSIGNHGASAAAIAQRQPSLKLRDVEVVLNYRTNRLSHLRSLWHQVGGLLSFAEFLSLPSSGFSENLVVVDTLGLALQFVRRGIRTTIIDMQGITERAEKDEFLSAEASAKIGGLQAVVACNVLRAEMCDNRGRLIINDKKNAEKLSLNVNARKDKQELDLLANQLNDIDQVMNKYDCTQWKYLSRYQKTGQLRILHPSKNLFESCGDNDTTPRLSFFEMRDQIKDIAVTANAPAT